MSNQLNAKELKEQASIVDFLARLGHHPVRKPGREKFYISMIRDNDTHPSFGVNDELGVWFDHGTGKGGNIIDLGLALWPQCTFNEVIAKIQDGDSAVSYQKGTRPRKAIRLPQYLIEEIKPIGTHPAISGYLESRGVLQLAKLFLSEVYYSIKDDKGQQKKYFAAGWRNESEGWELRNKHFKGCLGHKAISFITGDSKKLVVFEGFMNFLSWKTDNPFSDYSIVVLNTLALLPLGINKAKAFSSIDLYLDRDSSGFEATRDFIKALPYASDRSKCYDGHNDYNDKLKADLSSRGNPNDFFAGVKIPFIR